MSFAGPVENRAARCAFDRGVAGEDRHWTAMDLTEAVDGAVSPERPLDGIAQIAVQHPEPWKEGTGIEENLDAFVPGEGTAFVLATDAIQAKRARGDLAPPVQLRHG